MSDNDVTDDLIRKRAARIDVYCDGDAEFVLGKFLAWEAACITEGRDIPPAEFKARGRDDESNPAGAHRREACGVLSGGL